MALVALKQTLFSSILCFRSSSFGPYICVCTQDASLKDATGSFADHEDSPVIRGIKALRAVRFSFTAVQDLV